MKLLKFKILVLVIFQILVGCSYDSKKESDNEMNNNSEAQINLQTEKNSFVYVDTTPTYDYSDWKTVYFENIKIIYPENHMFADKMQETAQVYKTILRRSHQVFGLPEPTESITMFYYTGFGQGQRLANAEFPTTRGDTIFFWSGNKIGVTAAMHALKRWTNAEPSFFFLKDGIFRLLDATGRNYHVMTLDLIDSAKFEPLSELIVDERIDYHAHIDKTAELASFIDYFIYKFGIDNFRILYESKQEFEPTIEAICNMDLETIEKDWLNVVRQATKNIKN